MKTIGLTEGALNPEGVLGMASQENVILRMEDGREFVLAEVDSFDREVELTRKNQELMNFLDERSNDQGVFTVEQARDQLAT